MKKVVFICGEICSGKDTMIEICYSEYPYKQIDLGQLVREKFNTQERVFDNTLEPYFIERISEIISKNPSLTYVVTGTRQVPLIKKIANLFDECEYTYLVVPREILKERYSSRASEKDAKLTFEEAIKGDESLGMRELQNYLLTEVKCNFYNNY